LVALRHGYALFDDWRRYADGTMPSLELVTYFARQTTRCRPWFRLGTVWRCVSGRHSIAYQFLSMAVVLGSLLIMQWKLLNRALDNTVHVAFVFHSLLLMLQPGSYGIGELGVLPGLPWSYPGSAGG